MDASGDYVSMLRFLAEYLDEDRPEWFAVRASTDRCPDIVPIEPGREPSSKHLPELSNSYRHGNILAFALMETILVNRFT